MNKKTLYPLTFKCEDEETVLVEMSEEEAKIVERILKEANENLCSKYCGNVSINISKKIETDVI